MRSSKIFIVSLLIGVFILAVISCEYDVAEPQWYKDHPVPVTPTITGLNPDKVAPAGYNTIQVLGNNFGKTREDNKVYFDNMMADVIDASPTTITVRRPNLVKDSSVVKVVSYDALVVAKYEFYKIDRVMVRYGQFLENLQLTALVVDKDENVYVTQQTPRSVFKVAPNGETTMLVEQVQRAVSDAAIGPNGQLILMMANKVINQVNLETKEESEWVDAGKPIAHGDFDSYGNFYGGGRRSGLRVVLPDLSVLQPGYYTNDEILAARVYNNHLYLLVDINTPSEQEPDIAIWRHEILDGEGNLGEKELVLDWSKTGEYAESTIYTFTFSADGLMYIGTDYVQPVMILDPNSGEQDILYKDILPTYVAQMKWGTGNNIYTILGGEEWNIIKVDMGKKGAPYYNRD